MSSRRSQEGFSFVEILAAVAVAAVVMVGVSGLLRQTIYMAQLTQMRLTAAFLAQEGLELVRNIRDSKAVSTLAPDWDNVLATLSAESSCKDTGIIPTNYCKVEAPQAESWGSKASAPTIVGTINSPPNPPAPSDYLVRNSNGKFSNTCFTSPNCQSTPFVRGVNFKVEDVCDKLLWSECERKKLTVKSRVTFSFRGRAQQVEAQTVLYGYQF